MRGEWHKRHAIVPNLALFNIRYSSQTSLYFIEPRFLGPGEEHAVIELGILGFLGLVFTMRVNTLGRTQVTATGQNKGATASDSFSRR